jgi:hypothetical protein
MMASSLAVEGLISRTRATTLAHLYLGGLADHARHQRPGAIGTQVLLDLDRDDLGGIHLPVQELDHATQLARDLVGDKHHPHLPRTQILLDMRPELLDVRLLGRKLRDDRVRVFPFALALARKQLAHLLKRPVHDAVGGVVEHLPDDRPADPGIGASLNLDERRHSILVEEQMVDRPAAACVLVVRDRRLAADQQPAARRVPRVLVPRQQTRKLLDQLLQHLLGLVRGLDHLHKLVIATQEKDSTAHPADPKSPRRVIARTYVG